MTGRHRFAVSSRCDTPSADTAARLVEPVGGLPLHLDCVGGDAHPHRGGIALAGHRLPVLDHLVGESPFRCVPIFRVPDRAGGTGERRCRRRGPVLEVDVEVKSSRDGAAGQEDRTHHREALEPTRRTEVGIGRERIALDVGEHVVGGLVALSRIGVHDLPTRTEVELVVEQRPAVCVHTGEPAPGAGCGVDHVLMCGAVFLDRHVEQPHHAARIEDRLPAELGAMRAHRLAHGGRDLIRKRDRRIRAAKPEDPRKRHETVRCDRHQIGAQFDQAPSSHRRADAEDTDQRPVGGVTGITPGVDHHLALAGDEYRIVVDAGAAVAGPRADCHELTAQLS